MSKSPCACKGSVFCKKLTDIKNKREKLLIFSAFLFFTYLLYFFRIGCVWNYFFDFPCPTCGITRAYIAFFKGEMLTALKYHSMFWSVPLIFIYILYDGRILKNKTIDKIILILILSGFLVNWIVKF